MSSARCRAHWQRKESPSARSFRVIRGSSDAIGDARTVLTDPDLFGGGARLLAANVEGLDLLVLDAPHLFARPGNPYLGPDGQDWPDNAMRFAALAQVAADIGGGALKGYLPNVVHTHDWQAGLVSAYMHFRGGARPSTVMTVHNFAFSGKAPRELLPRLGLPPSFLRHRWRGVSWHDQSAQGWTAIGRSDHDRVSVLRGGNSHRSGWHGV